ncbi:MAG: dTDP-4-amino-4,6-dideoxygalactose transaminase [Bacteroidetes bacterium]|nr:dTDP-4-amino-4,6-dideoxygalactose transaminase [Bacteroidota bacterium]
MQIPFNKPYFPRTSMMAFYRAAKAGSMAGNGPYTRKCQRFFEERYGFRKTLMTTSCTDALEMAGLLTNIEPGDEVILPSFTFVSTANAFLLRGAKLVFADTLPDIPNINPKQIEALVTSRTKAIVVVHYCGIACEMDRIMEIARKNNLVVIEDAAHALDSFYNGKPLGSIGHYGTFSFHETKNIFCGEGGLLAVNDAASEKRAEIVWEKGTNRAAFYRGEVDKYGWVDKGSSFLPSDVLASFLYLQLKMLEKIQGKRIAHWNRYNSLLKPVEEKGLLKLPVIPSFATVNGNMFYFTLPSREEREKMLIFLRSHGIMAVFHYLPLHSSTFFLDKHDGRELPFTDRFSDCIVRLPFYYGLKNREIDYIVEMVGRFFNQ